MFFTDKLELCQSENNQKLWKLGGKCYIPGQLFTNIEKRDSKPVLILQASTSQKKDSELEFAGNITTEKFHKADFCKLSTQYIN